jgi:hypothetical protein
MSAKVSRTVKSTARPLCKREIDRRIDGVAATLASRRDDEADTRPRWIGARDLVERVQPFISDN